LTCYRFFDVHGLQEAAFRSHKFDEHSIAGGWKCS
jgi:hypothetical protein